jgi:O-6-methylguanine DNA methyltransferase
MKFAVSACKVGYVAVAVSDKGVCRVSFGTSPEVLKKEFESFQPDIEEVQTLEYLDKLLAWFQDPSVCLKDCEVDMRGTPFQLKVWEALRQIPSGETWTYGQLAQAIGRPSAYRACSAACSHNTIAIFIPCHRVIRGDGAPTGYHWGPDIKTALLEHETKVNPEDAMVDAPVNENTTEPAIPEAALSAELLAEELSGSAEVLSESSGPAEVLSEPASETIAAGTAEVQGTELSQEQESEKASPDTCPKTETSPGETEACTNETVSETETSVVETETSAVEAPLVEAETPVVEEETSTVEALSSPVGPVLSDAEVTPSGEDIPTVTVTPPPAEDLVAAGSSALL